MVTKAFGIGGNVNHAKETALSDYQLEALRLLKRHKELGLFSAIKTTANDMNEVLKQKGFMVSNPHQQFDELLNRKLIKNKIKSIGYGTQQGKDHFEITDQGLCSLSGDGQTQVKQANKIRQAPRCN